MVLTRGTFLIPLQPMSEGTLDQSRFHTVWWSSSTQYSSCCISSYLPKMFLINLISQFLYKYINECMVNLTTIKQLCASYTNPALHPSIHYPYCLSVRVTGKSQLTVHNLGRSPTCHKSYTDKHPFTLAFTPVDNLKQPVDLLILHCVLWGFKYMYHC